MKAPAISSHLAFLDGIRGFASVYVLLHHVWLASYPRLAGEAACAVCREAPAATQWLRFGQLAVVVFIVVSGFSLALSPLRAGWRLPGGFADYIRRRAWRIVPPYWVALGLSCVVVLVVTGPHSGKIVDAKAVLVHAVLLNNVIDSAKPNGTFWSIAVEWQIYFTFPLMLLVCRLLGVPAMAGLAAGASVLLYLLGTWHALLASALGLAPGALAGASKLLHLSTQFLACFAFGVAAAAAAHRRLPGAAEDRHARWATAAVLAATWLLLGSVPVAILEAHYFWVDLLAAAGAAMALVVLARRPGKGAARLLGSPLPRWLGQSSYSLYLIHAPMLDMVLLGVPTGLSGDARFVLLLATVVPLALAGSRLFWVAFERPFIRPASAVGAGARPPARVSA